MRVQQPVPEPGIRQLAVVPKAQARFIHHITANLGLIGLQAQKRVQAFRVHVAKESEHWAMRFGLV